MTNDGRAWDEGGPYDETTPGSEWYNASSDVYLYAYANGAVDAAKQIKEKGVTIRTIGIFRPMDGIPEEGKGAAYLFRQTAKDIASSAESFYLVEDPEKLSGTFDEVAQVFGGEAAQTYFAPGDVDMNEIVNSIDARLALRAAAKLETLTELQTRIADMDKNGKVDSSDARAILRLAAKLDPAPDRRISA